MNIENLNELNRIIETAIEYGRNDTYIEILIDAMNDFLYSIDANEEYIIEDYGKNIPQFVKTTY